MADAWPYLVLIVITLAGALFVVPWMAERIARREEAKYEGWLHAHEDRERHDPKFRRRRGREPESEGDR